MIQRIQSVFLALIVVILGALCGFSIIHYIDIIPQGRTTEYTLSLFYFNKLENGNLIDSQLQIGLISITSIIIGLSIYILMNYKNRVTQMKFTIFNMVAIVALIAAFSVKAARFIPGFDAEKLMAGSVVGIALLLFIAYLNVRVFFLIKKDDELVRSADRIR